MYINPSEVTSPRISISNLRPVCDAGEWEFSVAVLDWDHRPRIGVRWNGGTEEGRQTPGNPQSRGLPTWFVLPEEFNAAILQLLLDKGLVGGGSIDKANATSCIREELARYPNASTAESTKPKASEVEAIVVAVLKRMKAAGEL